MATLDMKGPYPLSVQDVDKQVTRTSAGNYALGYVDEYNVFIVLYVGRADGDVNSRVKDHVGEYNKTDKFKYSYATSPRDAFYKECKNYHDFGGNEKLLNKVHPGRPADTDWKCPVCGA